MGEDRAEWGDDGGLLGGVRSGEVAEPTMRETVTAVGKPPLRSEGGLKSTLLAERGAGFGVAGEDRAELGDDGGLLGGEVA